MCLKKARAVFKHALKHGIPEDQSELIRLFKLHYVCKREKNVKHFSRFTHKKWQSKCIRVHFHTGPPFTMNTAFKKRDDIPTAFRNAIEPQIAPLRSRGRDVDHDPPFSVLLNDFLQQECIEDVEVIWAGSPRQLYIKDAGIKKRWEDFHLKHATLTITTHAENIRRWTEHKKHNTYLPHRKSPSRSSETISSSAVAESPALAE